MPVIKADGDIRAAVVGYGLAASELHCPLIASTAGMVVSAVVTGNRQRAEAVNERYPDALVVPSVDELWSAVDDLDLVVIASPNRSHVPVGLAAMHVGLPVVVDKPVAASVAGALRLREAAERAGVLISVFHNRRWDGDALTLARLLREGAVGRVHRFESRYERWLPEVDAEAWRESDDPEDAGGLLYDLGSHLIDQALTLFGPVSAVHAEVSLVRPGARVDDDVFVSLTHTSAVQSQLWASAAAADAGPRFRLLGDAGAYVKYGMDVQEKGLREADAPGQPGWGVEPESAWGQLGTPGAVRAVPTVPGAYPDYYAGIRDALRQHVPPPVTISEAIAVMAVIEAAQRSAVDGGTVSLDSNPS